MKEKVLNIVNASDKRPLTDFVNVREPDILQYDIELKYYTTKIDETNVIQNVEGIGGAIQRYINWQRSGMGRHINPDELRKYILCPDWAENHIGAVRVEIKKPVFTELSKTQIAQFSGVMSISHEVVFE